MNVSILLLGKDVASPLGKDVASSYIKSSHGEMFHQEKHIERFSFEWVSKSNKKKTSYNLCVCTTLRFRHNIEASWDKQKLEIYKKGEW